MHETDDMVYFVDTGNIHQTILVRLPPVFVLRQDETCIDYLVPTEVREAFDKMETHARVYFSDYTRFESTGLLCTTTHKHTKSVPDKVGQFVEVVVAVVGIAKNKAGGEWDFVYHTIDVRAVDLVPPKLDEQAKRFCFF
jgi:hypothetical protein